MEEKTNKEDGFAGDASGFGEILNQEFRAQEDIYNEMIEMACNESQCYSEDIHPGFLKVFKIMAYQLSKTRHLVDNRNK